MLNSYYAGGVLYLVRQLFHTQTDILAVVVANLARLTENENQGSVALQLGMLIAILC